MFLLSGWSATWGVPLDHLLPLLPISEELGLLVASPTGLALAEEGFLVLIIFDLFFVPLIDIEFLGQLFFLEVLDQPLPHLSNGEDDLLILRPHLDKTILARHQ